MSIFGVNTFLHDLHSHLWFPDFNLPYLTHLEPQIGQLTCFITQSSMKTNSKEDIVNSLIHMQCNRLFGVNTDKEMLVRAVFSELGILKKYL